ncbi:MAG: 5-deoxy-glucuronate isomerase [Chloroflexi bacterium RBG_16_68_14]|nr:MAG: 5-deoxy-glucuronate isomerase [Chloroflexi bacterium RBG_16_68_14]
MLVPSRLRDSTEPGIVNRVTAGEAGWELLNLEVRRLAGGEAWEHETAECEAALVLLGGRCAVTSNRGEWPGIGRRAHVFDGMPYALYLPRRTAFTLTALTDRLEVAYCWVPTDQDHPARLVTPADCDIEIRGGHSATRQINSIIPPGFGCHRIVCVEVYTPGGNWSSYPPHKHDAHRQDSSGVLLEADLEEVYYYKIDKPQGYAIQRVYNPDRTIDAVMVCQNDDIVLVPEGYHPVAAAYGYNCYYLNFLAGSAQSLAYADDPDHVWTKDTWTAQDPRLPMVHLGMETG